MSQTKIPTEDLQNISLKPTASVEKSVLPSAEDISREKAPIEAANFDKENLKKVTPVVQDAISREKSIKEAASYDARLNLNKVEVAEKTRLPSSEDLARERAPLDAANFDKQNLKNVKTVEGTAANQSITLMKVESFDPSKLNKVESSEKSILNQEKSIIGAASFDQAKLNHVDSVEKSVLPSTEDINREKTMQNISSFQKEKLVKAETVEKDTLPTAEQIKAEAEQ